MPARNERVLRRTLPLTIECHKRGTGAAINPSPNGLRENLEGREAQRQREQAKAQEVERDDSRGACIETGCSNNCCM